MPSLLRGRKAEASLADHPTVRLVDELLTEAVRRGASDLHVAPDGGGAGAARMRVDGMLLPVRPLAAGELPRVVARLKVLAGLSAFRTGEPQDGSFRHDGLDVRLATIPSSGGERATVRFLGAPGAPRLVQDLGASDAAAGALRRLAAIEAGAVIVTGPCSSGKSTTLHALLREVLSLRGDFAHAATVEDPVELRLPGATQVEVDAARGLGFAQALAALLRHDPQVLLVGETRDAETARMAVEAAFTGHLVLTSLHVGGIDEVVPRLQLLGVPSCLVEGSLRAAVAQRLLRRACEACSARPGAGCAPCAGTGHRGRFAVAAIAERVEGGWRALTPSLRAQGDEAAARGVTSEAELARVLGRDLA